MAIGFRNGWNKGEFLIIDSESGMTRYSGQVTKDYTGERVTKFWADYEQPQDFIRPSDDPRPIPFANPGLQDFEIDSCITPYVGATGVAIPNGAAEHLFSTCVSTVVNSIQTKTITLDIGQTSSTVTIPSVNTLYTVVVLNGYRTNNTNDQPSRNHARVELTNATTVTAVRTLGTSFPLTVEVTIIEFLSSIVSSVIQGNISITSGNTSNTATISSVDISRSAIIYQGYQSGELNFSDETACTVELTNATTVTAVRTANTANTTVVGYTVIQFASGIIQSMQPVTFTATDSKAIETVTLTTPVTVSNCITLNNGINVTISEINRDGAYSVILTNANTVTFTSQAVTSRAKTLKATVIEFVPGIIRNRQANTTVLNSNTNANTAVNSVVNGWSFLNFNNYNISNTVNNPATNMISAVLSGTNDILIQKTTAGTNIANVAWELIEFA